MVPGSRRLATIDVCVVAEAVLRRRITFAVKVDGIAASPDQLDYLTTDSGEYGGRVFGICEVCSGGGAIRPASGKVGSILFGGHERF